MLISFSSLNYVTFVRREIKLWLTKPTDQNVYKIYTSVSTSVEDTEI